MPLAPRKAGNVDKVAYQGAYCANIERLIRFIRFSFGAQHRRRNKTIELSY